VFFVSVYNMTTMLCWSVGCRFSDWQWWWKYKASKIRGSYCFFALP